MANVKQMAILRQGTRVWNNWRNQNQGVQIDLSAANLENRNLYSFNLSAANLTGANLREAELENANLRGANLEHANLIWADLHKADLTEANLSDAHLGTVDLSEANMEKVKLCRANLSEADLNRTNISGADLTQANLTDAHLVRVIAKSAKFNNCRIYGISAWDVDLAGAEQSNLIITPPDQPTITVDNLKVAQFVYLLLNNAEVRDVLDTITSKAVLILGRFTPERKAILDAIRDKLRELGYVSIMFDFEKPESRNYIETVSTLAHLAKFIIADVTDAKVILQELERVVPTLPSVPVQLIVQQGSNVNVVLLDFVGRLNFIKHLYAYKDEEDVKQCLQAKVVAPAEAILAQIEQERVLFLEQVRRIANSSK